MKHTYSHNNFNRKHRRSSATHESQSHEYEKRQISLIHDYNRGTRLRRIQTNYVTNRRKFCKACKAASEEITVTAFHNIRTYARASVVAPPSAHINECVTTTTFVGHLVALSCRWPQHARACFASISLCGIVVNRLPLVVISRNATTTRGSLSLTCAHSNQMCYLYSHTTHTTKVCELRALHATTKTTATPAALVVRCVRELVYHTQTRTSNRETQSHNTNITRCADTCRVSCSHHTHTHVHKHTLSISARGASYAI